MAAQWSSETFVAEFKDLQANVMALDCLGSWALLAGKKVYAFVSLDNPEEGESSPTVVRVARQSKWDTCCVQFNPHASHAQLYVTACNQRLDIYSMDDKSGNARCSLKAHSWIISDVDWSPFDVNVVASCSIDSFTYLWDIRDSKKPVSTFQTVERQYSSSVYTCHFSKIYGLDWSPNSEFHLVTASQDCYVRIWDYTNPKNCEGSINSGAPVWRARYTPFGTGLMTVVVPQLRRGENSLYLWNMDAQNQVQPIHTFVGHKDVVLEFQWRRQTDGVRDYQLVTWSRDQSLRIWRIEPSLQRLCGHDTGEGLELDLTGSSYNSSESTIKDLRELSQSESGPLEEDQGVKTTTVMAQQPYSLQQEFNLMNKNIPNITIDEDERRSPDTEASFPRGQQPPIVQPSPYLPLYSLGSFQDSSIPFPRTSGARFCSNGLLVLFGVPAEMKKVSECFIDGHDTHKPRSGRHRKHELVDKSTKKQQSVGKVKIFDGTPLLGISRFLAQNYKLDVNDLEGSCRHNASIAASIGRRDLVQVWNMVSVMSSKALSPNPNPDSGTPWARLPFGRRLLQYICNVQHKDIGFQHSSTVGPNSFNLPPVAIAPTSSSTHGPPVHPGTGHMCEVASQPNLAALFKAAVAKNKRSLSWSESYDDFKIYDIKNPQERAAEQERLQHEDNSKMLDPARWQQHEEFKQSYARILYNWRLLEQRSHILQFTSTPVSQHKGLEFAVHCHKCQQEIRGPQCSSCKHPALQCAICHLGVLGAANFCLTCGHGGHTAHMMEWFMKKGVCPTGCGCDCLRENIFGGL
ncbi:hypothetical protein C0Q70_19230 [Pomacea canaliculata]|uniref:WDR59/RTC1-like RING zinc finger domain-containing protein n=1 Tax=Pomacea canaliculata TaxID=400727 RepID=A0A2T7NIS4_POMCA|nr:hypothetical protein C0Q70_19230 [Pomacea canaliculata]